MTGIQAKSTIASFCARVDVVKLEQLYALIDADMQAVDALIRYRLRSDVELIRQIAEYIVGAGGKRLRPALVVLAAGALDYQGTAHHEMATVIECIHTASLLHDDVVDESSMRRGRETANARFGNSASVLVGDFLSSRAFQMIVEASDIRLMRVLSEAFNVITEGEVMQLMNCHNADIEVDEYLQVIRSKTAKLFEAAARLGAIVGGADEVLEACFGAYGMHLGTAFQLVDDVLDYSGEEVETGKHLGDDLAEGKPTLPLIHVLKHGTAEQAACVRHAIETGGRDEFTEVLVAIRETGALEYTKECAQREVDLAMKSIDGLPASPYKKSLLELCLFAVARSY